MTQHNPAHEYQGWNQNHLCGNECKGFKYEKWPSTIQHMGYQGWGQNRRCGNACEGFQYENWPSAIQHSGTKVGAKITYVGMNVNNFDMKNWPSTIQHRGTKVGARITYVGMNVTDFDMKQMISRWQMTQHNPAQGWQGWTANHLCENECEGFQCGKWPSTIQHRDTKLGAKITYVEMNVKDFKMKNDPAQSSTWVPRLEPNSHTWEWNLKNFDMKNWPSTIQHRSTKVGAKTTYVGMNVKDFDMKQKILIWKTTQHHPAQGYQGWSPNHLCGNECEGFRYEKVPSTIQPRGTKVGAKITYVEMNLRDFNMKNDPAQSSAGVPRLEPKSLMGEWM